MTETDSVLQLIQRQIADGMICGARTYVERNGDCGSDHSYGLSDPGAGVAMMPDAIFRIGSMSKPICTVAALAMMDDGLLDLDDPIVRFAPEFGKPRGGGAQNNRPITIRDLMRHTAGLAYPHEILDPNVRETWLRANPHRLMSQTDGDGFIAALSNLPCTSPPGEVFAYGYATDLLGCLMERIDGAPLDAIIADRVTGPAGMSDTGFVIPQSEWHRVAVAPVADSEWYRISARIGEQRPDRSRMFSAGGGMVSTIADYAKFMRILLGRNDTGEAALLSNRARDELFRHQLPDGVRGPDAFCGHGYGFGLGFAVRHDWGTLRLSGKAGESTWSGIGGTAVFFDPNDNWFALYFASVSASRALARMQFRWAVEACPDPLR